MVQFGNILHPLSLALKARSVFIDTIGLGDPELSDEQIVFRTREFINNCIKGIMLSWLGRLSKNDRLHLDFFEKLFDDRWRKQSVLVLTYYDGDMDQQKEALVKWCGEEEYIKKFVTSLRLLSLTTQWDVTRKAHANFARSV